MHTLETLNLWRSASSKAASRAPMYFSALLQWHCSCSKKDPIRRKCISMLPPYLHLHRPASARGESLLQKMLDCICFCLSQQYWELCVICLWGAFNFGSTGADLRAMHWWCLMHQTKPNQTKPNQTKPNRAQIKEEPKLAATILWERRCLRSANSSKIFNWK